MVWIQNLVFDWKLCLPILTHSLLHRLIEAMMGKSSLRRSCGGPCSHCYVTVTPCWRKGPPEKPILCNACGARYLVKKTLEGYMPGQRSTTKQKRSQNQWTNQHRNKIHRNETSSSGSSEMDPFDRRRRSIRKNPRTGSNLIRQRRGKCLNKNNSPLFKLTRSDKVYLIKILLSIVLFFI